ncbi:MAG TPA: 30S ribosomal protein S8 [bacterium]|nr:30S ribosomal protein S8 [bacterium]
MTHPISDMVVRIKNAYKVGKERVSMPYSKLKENICEILKEEGFINDFTIENVDLISIKSINIKLAYFEKVKPVIVDIKTTSTPGIKFYKKVKDMRRYKNGLGVEIFSTSSGILTDVSCRKEGVGGLSLLTVF